MRAPTERQTPCKAQAAVRDKGARVYCSTPKRAWEARKQRRSDEKCTRQLRARPSE
jgi:hypothetical protein